MPTLVTDGGRVTTDSENIMMKLDSLVPSGAKIAPPKSAKIDELMARMDSLPIGALSYGAHPPPDPRPKLIQRMASPRSIEIKKRAVARCLATYADDPVLGPAYAAAARQASFQDTIANTDMVASYVRETSNTLGELEAAIEEFGHFERGAWICGEAFTALEMGWAVALHRLDFLGLRARLGELPRSWAFYERALARPSFQRAVVAWGPKTLLRHLPRALPKALAAWRSGPAPA